MFFILIIIFYYFVGLFLFNFCFLGWFEFYILFFKSRVVVLRFLFFFVSYIFKNFFYLFFLTTSQFLISILFFVRNNFPILFLFYELSLIPVFLILLFSGERIEKFRATYYIIFLSFLFSSPLILIYFYIFSGVSFSGVIKNIRWEGLTLVCFSFFVKIPTFFFHVWLPKAHVESPTFLSIILAAIF